MIRAATCFSGIGAPEMGLPSADWRWHAEFEAFPSAVMAHRHPDSVNLGDVTADDFLQRASAFGQLDLLVGGPPCQAFSVAGLRQSLSDDRGNLSLRWVEIINAVRPRIAVTENVPGWLNTPDNAFGCFLGAIVGADDALHPPVDGGWPSAGMVAGPRARLAWRVLDAQYFGVAQRRRRVFVVSSADPGIDPAAILFEPRGLRRNPPSRGEQGEGTAHELAPCLTSSGRGVRGGGESRGQDPVVAEMLCAAVAPTLNAHFGDKQGLEDQHINGGGGCSFPSVSMCLNAGSMGRRDAETETLIPVNRCGFDVAHSLRGEGFDASEDGTGRGTPIVPIAFSSKDSGNDATSDLSPTLRSLGAYDANGGGQMAVAVKHTMAVAFDTTQITHPENRSNPKPGGPVHPLAAGAHPPAVAFDLRGREGGAQFEGPHDTANIRAASGGSSRSCVAQSWAVRRLTPTECERLQGFPDDYTDVPWRGKQAPDGPRYKALGNSMAVPCIGWILRRCAEALA